MARGKEQKAIRIASAAATVGLCLMLAIAGIWHWHPYVPDESCPLCSFWHAGTELPVPQILDPLIGTFSWSGSVAPSFEIPGRFSGSAPTRAPPRRTRCG